MGLEKNRKSKINVKFNQVKKTFWPLNEDKLGDSYLTVRMNEKKLYNFTKIFLIFVGKQFFILVLFHFLSIFL